MKTQREEIRDVVTARNLFLTMSTFKTQPIYAELTLKWLDMAFEEQSPYTVDDVLQTVAWNFKGGRLGAYAQATPSASSETAWPTGSTKLIAESYPDGMEGGLLRMLLATRAVEQMSSRRNKVMSCAVFAAVRAIRSDFSAETGYDPQVVTGLKAVYVTLRQLLMPNNVLPDRRAADDMAAYTREMMIASAAASNLDVPTVEKISKRVFDVLASTSFGQIEQCRSQFITHMSATRGNKPRGWARRVGGVVWTDGWADTNSMAAYLPTTRSTWSGYAVWRLPACLVVRLPQCVVALSSSDLARMHQFLTGYVSGLVATVSQAAFAPGAERGRVDEIAVTYMRQVDDILRWGSRVRQGDEVLVCKSAKRAFAAYLAELAGPIAEDDAAALWLEATTTGGVPAAELRAHIARVQTFTAGTSFNLGKVYKICPAADTCPGLTLLDRHEQVTNPNPVVHASRDAFTRNFRAQMLRALVMTPGHVPEMKVDIEEPEWWTHILAKRFDLVPSSELEATLAWEGSRTMPPRSAADPSVWKDSGLGWDSAELAVDERRNNKHANMLLRMVFDPECPMPGKRYFGHAHDHKADMKPENYKDPARCIYSGNIRDRLNQSWMESAVESVARYHPSFMVGADSVTKEERVRSLLTKPVRGEMVAMYYSFDVSGWSSKMPAMPQRAAHAFFGELFDEPLFRRAHEINEGARVYMNKQGFRGWYENPVANFEGYNGKEMTCVLITLLSMSVERWRAEVSASGMATMEEMQRYSAMLQAYIDDGMARLDLPADRAEELFRIFRGVVVVVFAECGFSVEVTKCYPSDRFWIFLNEIYIAGRHVVHGSRAAATICAENTEPHTTLIERVGSVASGVRGAVAAGLDAITGSFLLAVHTWRHIREWSPRMDPVAAAIWSVAPHAWGGLGIPSAMLLGTSGSGAAMAEGALALQRFAGHSVAAKRFYLRCMREPLVVRTPSSIMSSPLGGRLASGPMTESRIPGFVRDALRRLHEKGGLSPLAAEFLAHSSFANFTVFSDAVIPVGQRTVLQAQVIDDLSTIHPHHIFLMFVRRLDKSTTLSSLISQKDYKKIIRANRQDVAASVEALTARIL
jgi:hypothetical protein